MQYFWPMLLTDLRYSAYCGFLYPSVPGPTIVKWSTWTSDNSKQSECFFSVYGLLNIQLWLPTKEVDRHPCREGQDGWVLGGETTTHQVYISQEDPWCVSHYTQLYQSKNLLCPWTDQTHFGVPPTSNTECKIFLLGATNEMKNCLLAIKPDYSRQMSARPHKQSAAPTDKLVQRRSC